MDDWMFRPRDKYDDDLPPGSWRYELLATLDKLDEAWVELRRSVNALPWYRRWLFKAVLRMRGVRL